MYTHPSSHTHVSNPHFLTMITFSKSYILIYSNVDLIAFQWNMHPTPTSEKHISTFHVYHNPSIVVAFDKSGKLNR